MKNYKLILILFIFISILGSLYSLDYSLYGDINLSPGYKFNPDIHPENKLIAELEVTANHRLLMSFGEFYAHHSLSIDETADFNHNIYEVYLYLMPHDNVTLSFGKQRINWGTAYAFSPTDRLHPQTGVWDLETGFPGVAVTYAFSSDISLTACVSIENSIEHYKSAFWEDFRYALYFSALLGKADLFVSTVYQYDEILVPGVGFSYDLFGFIIYSEAAIEFHNQTLYPNNWERPDLGKPYFSIDSGVEKTISGDNLSFTFVTEYLYRQSGYTKEEEDLFFTYLLPSSWASADTLESTDAYSLLGRHYLFAAINLSHFDYFSFDNSIIWNLQDLSFIAAHEFKYIGFENFDIFTKITWTSGERGKTEYGCIPDRFILNTGVVIHY